MREILNGVFYVLRSGCSWRMMTHDLPKWKTVYDYFKTWRIASICERLNGSLRKQVRAAEAMTYLAARLLLMVSLQFEENFQPVMKRCGLPPQQLL